MEEGVDPARFDPFNPYEPKDSVPQPIQPLPSTFETWLLAPFPCPDAAHFAGQPALITITLPSRDREGAVENIKGIQTLTVNIKDESNDAAAIYNIIYRYLYDRHRDLSLPTSFLIDGKGNIVKIYQGPLNPKSVEDDLRHIPQTKAERLTQALPFPGVSETYEFGRNHLSYGSLFFQRGYLEQAQTAFSRALHDDPSSAEAYYGLGSIDLQQENLRAARTSFEEAVKLKSTFPDTAANAWNNLGLIATREGRLDEAIRSLLEAVRLNPDHFVALENLGNAYRQQKRWQEARQTLEHALALRPQDPEANYSLAMVFAQTDQVARAYDYLQRALKVRPTYPEALNNLGVLYLRTHRRDEAVAKFEDCIRVAPGFDQSYLNLARVYSIEGTPDKAREVLRSLLKQHPDDTVAKKMLDQLQ